jgi:hypothetical protein
MLAAAMMLLAAVSTVGKTTEAEESSVQSMLNEEAPDVFLAKATLQQYLSRVVRKDWEGTRRLTHPKALGVLEKMKRRGAERHGLAPWGDADTRLETFRFMAAREVSPGVILVSTGEDNFHVGEQNVSADDPAVYVLLRYRGSYLIADKKVGVQLSDVSPDSIRQAYPGWAESPRMAEARRGPNRLRRR